MSTFPEDPEHWSEYLVVDDGQWLSGECSEVYLDRVYKKSGEACIACKHVARPVGYPQITETIMSFRLNEPKDLRGFETINFLHLLEAVVAGQPAFTGDCQIALVSFTPLAPAGLIYKYFGSGPGAYESKVFDIHKDFVLGLGKSIEEVLRWVNYITIKCSVAYPMITGQRCFIDRIYFAKALGILYVDSVPIGKTFTFDGRGFVTPHGFKGAVGDEHTVVMGNKEFVKWENESTDLTRNVVIPDGTATITAYYKGVPPPEEEKPFIGIPREVWIGLGIVGLSAVSLVAYDRYTRRR